MQSNPALEYDYSIAKLFLFATIVFGIVGLLLGVIIAFQMAFPNLNYLAGEFGTFGRLRPLHTNGIIYGFTLSGIWAAWYYLGQRVLKISYNEHPFLKFIGYLHFVLYIVLDVFLHLLKSFHIHHLYMLLLLISFLQLCHMLV